VTKNTIEGVEGRKWMTSVEICRKQCDVCCRGVFTTQGKKKNYHIKKGQLQTVGGRRFSRDLRHEKNKGEVGGTEQKSGPAGFPTQFRREGSHRNRREKSYMNQRVIG